MSGERADGSVRAHMVVAIDGPAASGKSSTARWVAERLGYRHVDSGALYRAVTLVALRDSGDPAGWNDAVLRHVASSVTLAPAPGGLETLVGGATVG